MLLYLKELELLLQEEEEEVKEVEDPVEDE